MGKFGFRSTTGDASDAGTWRAEISLLFQQYNANSEGKSIIDTGVPVTKPALMEILRNKKQLFDADSEYAQLDEEARYKKAVSYIIGNQEKLMGRQPDAPVKFEPMSEEDYFKYLEASANEMDRREKLGLAQDQAAQDDAQANAAAAAEADAPSGNAPGSANSGDGHDDASGEPDFAKDSWAMLVAKGVVSKEFVNRAQAIEALDDIFARSQRQFRQLADPMNYLSSSKTSVSSVLLARRLGKLNKQFEKLSGDIVKENVTLREQARNAYMKIKHDGPEASDPEVTKGAGLFNSLKSRLTGGRRAEAGTNPGKSEEAEAKNGGSSNKIYIMSKGAITKAFRSTREFLDSEGGKLKKSESKIGLVVGSGLFMLAHPLRTVTDMGHKLSEALSSAISKNKSPETPPVTPEAVDAMHEGMTDKAYGVGTPTDMGAAKFMAAMFAAAGNDPERRLVAYNKVIEVMEQERSDLEAFVQKRQEAYAAAMAAVANKDEPVKTDGAAKPDEPVKTDGAAKPDEPVKTDGAAKPDEPVKTDGATKPDESVKTDGDTKTGEPTEKDVTVKSDDAQKDGPVKMTPEMVMTIIEKPKWQDSLSGGEAKALYEFLGKDGAFDGFDGDEVLELQEFQEAFQKALEGDRGGSSMMDETTGGQNLNVYEDGADTGKQGTQAQKDAENAKAIGENMPDQPGRNGGMGALNAQMARTDSDRPEDQEEDLQAGG